MYRVNLVVVVAAAATTAMAAQSAPQAFPVPDAARQFLARPHEPMPATVAVRRLDARAQRFAGNGWMRVRVTVTPGVAMTWVVLDEGGSDYIRHKVLRKLLEGEAETVRDDRTAGSGLELRNYRFESLVGPAAADVPDGLARFRVAPKRADMMLVDGTVWVSALNGDLVQVDGRLAKAPSFWTKTVDVLRRYARVDGVRVPVLTESTADVRLAGRTVLRMTYEYEVINGQPVSGLTARKSDSR